MTESEIKKGGSKEKDEREDVRALRQKKGVDLTLFLHVC